MEAILGDGTGTKQGAVHALIEGRAEAGYDVVVPPVQGRSSGFSAGDAYRLAVGQDQPTGPKAVPVYDTTIRQLGLLPSGRLNTISKLCALDRVNPGYQLPGHSPKLRVVNFEFPRWPLASQCLRCT